MTEEISLAEAGRRLEVSRQCMSQWRTVPGFPPVTRRGRALTVEWEAVRSWVSKRQRKQRQADALVADHREFRRLRGLLWTRARWLFSPPDLSMMLEDCATPDDLRRRAREWGIRLP